MVEIKQILLLMLVFTTLSCNTGEQTELTEPTADTVKKTGVLKPVDYVPRGTNESSAGDTKRERKFYIR
jgi:hypothetical protein